MTLTENQKNLLRWIVQEVRAGHLKEDSIWYIRTLTDYSWVDYNGFDSPPYVEFATFDILEEYGYIKWQQKSQHQYKGALTGKAYEAVDSNFAEPAISSQKVYAKNYYNHVETMTENKGNVNISGVQGNVSGIAAAGENQTMTGVALGQISGVVTNSIGQLQSTNTPEATQLATLLEQLQSAIKNESHLAPEDKAEAMEQVKTLAEAGQKPEDNALQKAAKTALKILKGTIAGLPDAAKLAESCAKLLPAIATLLSLS
ncbi:hypothetical protein [Microcystis aeruginosa]|nr:hypothetical protein [Microcystis aeruginosa]